MAASTTRTKASDKSESKAAKSVKTGDPVDFDGPAAYVRLPDGTVVTARTGYIARHPGKHALITVDPDTGETTEHEFEVTETEREPVNG